MELKKYDIVLVDFGESVSSEQGGIRPAIIIQNDIGNRYSPTTIVMSVTSKYKNINQPTHTLLRKGRGKGLYQDSMVLGEQIRVISKERIIKHLGSITNKDEQAEIKRVYLANFGE